MSLFGTFRRPKGKKVSKEPVFSSTPNLYKIDQNARLPGKLTGPPTVLQKSGGGSSNMTSDGSGQTMWGFEGRRISSVSEAGTGEGDGNPNVPSYRGPLSKKSSISSTSSSFSRHFVSMMNVMGSLKRSKSTRKFPFGSTVNVSKEGSSVGVTKEFSFKTPSSFSKSKSKTSGSKSEEFLSESEDVNDSIGPADVDSISSTSTSNNNNYSANNNNTRSSRSGSTGARRSSRTNTEPGVESSASSSESGSLHDTNSMHRASSEKSDIMEESDDEVRETRAKTPEELERQRTLLLGIKKFNMDPKKGIEFLVDKGVIQDTKEGVAGFLKFGVGLSKASIGNYLGERIDFNEEVLKAFVDLHDFKGVNLVQALRQFLWSFRLPGESQKISRMLDAFADRYCQLNPELFSVDTCSVLCYSIIMLNTELHNPNVKEKATVDQFIKRNRGIEGGQLLSHAFMVSLYGSILTEPFRFPEEDGNDLMLTFFNPDIEGHLYKYGGRPRSWKRFWFILTNNCLYFFKFTTDKTPLGIIPLENVLVRVPVDKSSNGYTMILYKESPDPRVIDEIKTCKTLPDGQTVPKLYSVIQLRATSREERGKWVKSINANHSMSRVYSDLTLKKMKMSKSQSQLGPMKPAVVRKSQISSPATALGADLNDIPVPLEVQQCSSKDPRNFFTQKNLSSISLASNPSDYSGTFPRSKSSSKSRLNNVRLKSKSPSMSTISQSEELRRSDPDLERTLTAEDLQLDWSDTTVKGNDDVLNDLSPTNVTIDFGAETAHFHDNQRKLSLVQENSQTNPSSVTPPEEQSPAPTDETSSVKIVEALERHLRSPTRTDVQLQLEDDPSCPTVELLSYTRKSSIPAPDDVFLKGFESQSYRIPKLVIDEAPETPSPDLENGRTDQSESDQGQFQPLESSTEDLSQQHCQNINTDLNQLPLEVDFSSDTDSCHSIQVIDCRRPDVQTKTFSGSNRFGTTDFSQTVVLTKAPVPYVDSIYESNV